MKRAAASTGILRAALLRLVAALSLILALLGPHGVVDTRSDFEKSLAAGGSLCLTFGTPAPDTPDAPEDGGGNPHCPACIGGCHLGCGCGCGCGCGGGCGGAAPAAWAGLPAARQVARTTLPKRTARADLLRPATPRSRGPPEPV